MRYARSLARTALVVIALSAGARATLSAQATAKALVYCPVGIDTSGCDNIVAALGAAGTGFSAVDRGWDGTGGTVDLASADLAAYAVVVVPSLADGADGRPYDRLRGATVAGRFKAAITGRQAIWSGTPDLGTAGASDKTTLLQSLAAWAASGSGTGLVALLDGSDSTAQRYDWVTGISALVVVADSMPGTYAAVRALTPTGAAITAPGGQALAYANMAAFGLHAGSGTTEDAADSATGMPILVSTPGASAAAPAPAPTGLRALVYCPAADTGGCDNIVAALTGAGTPFAGGVDRGYDGASGTLDLRTADLSPYGVLVVPSLADGADGQPYAMLRDAAVAARLKAALLGPVAVWSGTPDLGDSSRVQKNILISNLAKWAAAAAQTTAGARGLVALQDASDSVPARYSWVSLISRVAVGADSALDVYSNVQTLTPTAVTLLDNGSGIQLGYTNMASFGLLPGSGLGADAAGGRTSAIVLATSASGGGAASGFATVTTDREDYQPGDTITVTGAGWAPGETVSLLFHEEVSPPIHPDKVLTAVADANGHILNHQYEIENTDLGVRFTLVATGQTSGRTAQTTFTDSPKVGSVVLGAQTPSPVLAGNNATYPVTVNRGSGSGSSGAFTAALTATGLPAGATASFSPNPIPFTSSQASGAATLTVSTTGATPAGPTTFKVKAATSASDTAGTTASLSVTPSADLAIAKTHSGNFVQGQTGATYAITVSNLGTLATSGTVTVTDAVPSGLTLVSAAGTGWSCPGASMPCTRADALGAGGSYPVITLTVDVSPTAPATVTNTATVAGGGEGAGAAVAANNTASDPTIVQTPVDLTINKSHSGNFTVGQQKSYTLTVANAGQTATTGTVTVTDNLPTGMSFVSAAGTGWACAFSAPTVTCTRTISIAGGGSAPDITLTVLPQAAAVPGVTNVASVSGGGEPAGKTANNSDSDPTTVNGVVDLVLDKSHSGAFTEGVNGAYTLTVSNAGSASTTGTVTVTDNLPTGLGFVSASGTGWTCGFSAPTVTCTQTTSIVVGGSAPAITLTVSVAAAAVPSVTNTASVSGGNEPAGNTGNNSDSDPTAVTAANQPPVAVNDGPYTVNEDNTLTVLPAQGVLANDTDPDGDSPLTAILVTGPAASATASFTLNSDGSFSFKPAVDFNGSVSFTYRANDGKTNSTSPATVSITVTPVNDAPSFTKGADQTVLEDASAQSVANWASNFSAGPADESAQTLTLTATNDNNALFSVQPSVDQATGALAYTPAPDGNGSAVVTLELKDNGGTANGGVDTYTTTFNITVTPVNDAPSFTKGADQTVNEDAGLQTVAGWATVISAGPGNESGQALSFTVTNDDNGLFSTQPAVDAAGKLTYKSADDANGAATVTVVLKDDGGTANGGVDTSAPQTFTITVTPVNDAPSFTKGADQTVLEDAGAQSVPGWASKFSAGPADESAQALALTATNDNNGLFSVQPSVDETTGTLTYTPAPDANGSAVVTLELKDNGGTANGGVDTYTTTFNITVTPVNDAPSFTKGGDKTVNEGDGAQSFAGWASAIKAGPANESGQALTFTVTNDNNGLFTVQPAVDAAGKLTFTPASGPNGTATVTVVLKDDGGTANGGVDTSAPQTFVITVNNVAPAVSNVLATPNLVAVGLSVSASASFTDPGAGDTHTATIAWGDGPALGATVNELGGNGSVTGSHIYTSAGVYTVTVTVTDNDGGSGNAMYQYVVVYDPSAGFVTGGGWINSPLGAYALDPTLTGKANFGFVSKYQKGANVPTGNTEFQFHAAGLNFKSTAYQWLVVSGGSKASYKGSGTINGSGDYGFLLSAVDASTGDKFRIKIWDKATSAVVYDNQMGAADDATATTVIAGGSIVVQTSSNTASK